MIIITNNKNIDMTKKEFVISKKKEFNRLYSADKESL
jgi:hypothetical protein